MYGINLDVENDQVWWSALADKDFIYTQRWGDKNYTLACEKGIMHASLNGRELFSCTAGVRVVTDGAGVVREVAGIDSEPRHVTLIVGAKRSEINVAPNQVYRLDGAEPALLRAVPFDYQR
jgi:hypothetical protein